MRIRHALPSPLLPVALALALGPLFGCATLLNGSSQKVHVETDPPGATVTVGGERRTSPVDLVLPRKSEGLEIVVEKEGYATKRIPLVRKTSGTTWLNLLGVPVGAAAGAAIAGSRSSTSSGFENAGTGAVVGALVLGSAGFVVDAGTGAMHRLDPPFVAVKLEPLPPAGAGSAIP